MPYDPRAIANALLEVADQDGQHIDHMKLQKLTYYVYGWNLAIKGEPLFDETIKAWTYGPVVPSLYREFCRFGSNPILEKASQVDFERMAQLPPEAPTPYWTPSLEDDADHAIFTRELVRKIWERYGRFNGVELSAMTHEPGTPWDQVSKQYGGNLPRNVAIPDALIRTYFVELARPKATAS